MSTNVSKRKKVSEIAMKLVRHPLFIPIAALLLLAIFNLINNPSFYKVTLENNSAGEPVLLGQLITILDSGSELAILAIGMTLVTAATGGQDISVGATMTISGCVAIRMMYGLGATAENMQMPFIAAFLISCVVAMLCGAFNGVLVAYFKIQPMVATLILYTAGRSIAAWIHSNANLNVKDSSFMVFGGYIPGFPVPTPIIITLVCAILMTLVLRFTNLKLYTQAVGINESSSRLNGLNSSLIKVITFVILGVCVAVAGLISASRSGGVTYSVLAKDIEMDAILAVALGGNALSGGKFSMGASILGAYAIQFLETTLTALKVPSTTVPAYKAMVVILLVIISAPTVRKWFSDLGKKLKTKVSVKEVG